MTTTRLAPKPTLRRLVSVVVLAAMVLTPSIAGAQDQPDEIPSPTVATLQATTGLTVEELIALEPNPAWDALGLFSEDVNSALGVLAGEREQIFYAFGDDPTAPPVLDVDGTRPLAFGRVAVRIPEGWAPPAAGVNDGVAFAVTGSAGVGPGDIVMLYWAEFDSAHVFDPDIALNEGFPMAIAGLPVWNSSFAGDTWEGANIIPNAVYDGGVLTFDVKSYEPPQSFPLVDVSAFYYRSGTVMAMGINAQSLVDHAASQGVFAGGSGGNGASAPVLGQSAVTDESIESLIEVIDEIIEDSGGYSHVSRGGVFRPGFIWYLIQRFGASEELWIILDNAEDVFNRSVPPTDDILDEAIEEIDEALGEDEAEQAEEAAVENDTAEQEAATTTDDTADQGTATTDDGGGSLAGILIAVLGVAIVVIGWLVSRRRSTRPTAEHRHGGDFVGIVDPRDGVPGLTPPDDDDPVDRRCGWEVKFDDGGGNWVDIKSLGPNEDPCCVYKIQIETVPIFDFVNASFRQDAPAERLYIPAYEQSGSGLDWKGLTGTRSGPFGRQDWQHGDGDPVDTEGEGDPTSYWQGHQGEERPDVICQSLHFEVSRVKAWLEPGCPDHVNTFGSSGELALDVVLSEECTNDDPGPACPVELNAFGGTFAAARGDLFLQAVYENGTDIDEIERHIEAYEAMSPAERDRQAPPVLPVIGSWDGHDHQTRDKATFPERKTDGVGRSTVERDTWEAAFFTFSASLNGQLVPVAVWPTTERVSTAMDVHAQWTVNLDATLTTPSCTKGTCAGHPDRVCHGGAGFQLKLGSAGNTIAAAGNTATVDRGTGNVWEIGSTTSSGAAPTRA